MISTLATVFTFIAAALAAPMGGSISITPHQQFSSSIGVLGCKINTNRVAYWPLQPGCDNLCVKVSANGRSVHLLQIDTSGGAYDISYDAWNYLKTGKSAEEDPQMGGGEPAVWEPAPISDCEDLLDNGKLPLMAANSMNFYSECALGRDTWVGKNTVLYNIGNSACTIGFDEVCDIPDLAAGLNQAKCPHTLGLTPKLEDHPVYDIAYGTGKAVVALQ